MTLKSSVPAIDSVKCFAHIWIILSNEAEKFVPEYFDEGTQWMWDINVTAGSPDDDECFENMGLIFTDLANTDSPDKVFTWEQVANIVSLNWPDEFSKKG